MPGGRFPVAVAVGCALALLAPAATGQAATKPVTTHLKASAVPATAKVATTVTVSGTVSPKGGTVTLQRAVGKKWLGLTHAKVSRTGAFVLAFHAPKSPVTLALRVVRPASSKARAGVSATLHVHVVTTAYAVSAAPSSGSLTTPAPLTVSGKVAPRATGTVTVQRLVGKSWVAFGKAVLSKASTFAWTKALAPGSYRLRVSKAFNAKVAGGVSKAFAVTVVAPPPVLPNNPVVATTALPALTAGRPVSSTLTATGGTAPYSWAVVAGALPPGLSLVPTGLVSGAPTNIGTSSFTVRVTDAVGRSGVGVVSATVGPVVVSAWGYNLNGETGNGTTAGSDNLTTTALPGNVKAIAVGLHYSLALLTDGTVYSWGQNNAGQLGLGDMTDRPVPTRVTGLAGVVSVAAGLESSYAVTGAGQLYAWGANESGELGNGTASSTDALTPQLVPGLINVVGVAAANQYVLALLGNGLVDAWGNGMQGTLGDGTETPQQKTPQPIPTLSGVRALSAGQVAAYALLADGTVKAWGLKEHGQLGNTAPPDAGLWEPKPVPVTGLTGAASLACGFEYCVVARTDGSVWAWGNDTYGVEGNGAGIADNMTAAAVPGLSSIVQVAAGYGTAYALRGDGALFAWGADDGNQLGTGDPTHTSTSSPPAVPTLANAFGVAAGSQTAFALRAG